MQQASCLEGGPLLWIWPLYLHVNQKSDDDDDDDDDDDRIDVIKNFAVIKNDVIKRIHCNYANWTKNV